jgi:C4-dicarboxylate-specific signal transduction histidine kinase
MAGYLRYFRESPTACMEGSRGSRFNKRAGSGETSPDETRRGMVAGAKMKVVLAAEARLTESQVMLAHLQKLSLAGSWRWNVKSGEISRAIETGQNFGFLAEEEGRSTIDRLFESIHPEERPDISQIMLAAAEQKHDFDVKFRIVEGDAIRYLRTLGESRTDGAGCVYYLCTSADVTERELREEALQRANAAVQHLTRVHTIGKFTSSVVHEVNQPLSAVVAHSAAALNWLHRDEPDAQAASIAINGIIRAATRATEVIARMRRLSKNGSLRKTWFSIEEVIEETLALLAADLCSRRIAIHSTIRPRLPEVVGDRVQIQQVLINLILNSIESLEAIHSRTRAISVLAEAAGSDRLRVVVQDNGAGVAADAAARLFEPFFSTKEEGLGMGLSICRSIIEAHNGTLDLLSCKESGAQFEFVLPVCARA